MSKMVKATECKCIICGKPAVAFWPVVDPDIPQHPYCRKCLNEQQLKVFVSMFGEDEGTKLYRKARRMKKKDGSDG